MQPETSAKTKKALIVVGKMGSGKSSFINTLLHPAGVCKDLFKYDQDFDETELLATSSSAQNSTSACALRRLNPCLDREFGKELYVIDTMGLDSLDSFCLVAEKIDSLVVEQAVEIVGIAYLPLTMQGRQIPQGGVSFLKQFLQYLKLPKQKKSMVTFLVIPFWDMICKNKTPKQIEKMMDGYKKMLMDVGVDPQKCRIVEWTNNRDDPTPAYDEFVNSDSGRKKIIKQWDDLSQVLKSNMKTFQIYSIQNYMSDRQKFYLAFSQQIDAYISKMGHSISSQIFELGFEIEIEKLTKNVSGWSIFGILTGAFGAFGGLVATFVTGAEILAAGAALATLGPFALAVLVLGGSATAFGFSFRHICQNQKEQSLKTNQQSENSEETKEVLKIVEQKIKTNVLAQFFENFVVQKSYMIWKCKSPTAFTNKIEVSYLQENKTKCHVLNLAPKQGKADATFKVVTPQEYKKNKAPYSIVVSEKSQKDKNTKVKFLFNLHYNMPNSHVIFEIIKNVSSKVYGQY